MKPLAYFVIEDHDLSMTDKEIAEANKRIMQNMTITIDSHIKPPKTRRKRECPPAVQNAFKSYSAAHRAVYGKLPSGFRYDKKTRFIHVDNEPGVSVKRLGELTRMLRARIVV